MPQHPDDLHPETVLVAGGRPDKVPGASLSAPVTFTSTYVAGAEPDYARSGNPTWTAFEEVLGELEGGRALAFSSGMGAIAAAMSLCPPGGTVVAGRHVYSGTGGLLEELAAEGRTQVRRVPIDDTRTVIEALPGATLLWLESPSNPMMEVADLAALCAAARAANVITVCDNTFMTPILQRPLSLGADVVVHSVTKFLSGHSDVVMGATVTADPELHARLLTRRTLHGAIPGPMETWLALRGMRTMALRMERGAQSAAVLAGRLGEHPAVSRVRYPGVGAMLSIELTGGLPAALTLEDRVAVWTNATSLGGVESLLERRRRHALEVDTVPEDLVRLAVGIEHVEDLWADLLQALEG
ncbi:PLP-dependent aspartate aminotransferase family protein [Branchiibius sp. NY16-3462-2]|uniref:trans-sulfuration enzyme family protein n=1 Tax=Branchiibius sp. NY16-3462-2 TaxID=1807500 RepID=UPI000798D6AD|nr:PLP-dependent transferase [Branchiibius sp. NY16-3462-2]KYH43313.1 cystathionine gamma-synthase [Branchiibius sp. NY16-3462-2]